MKTKLTIIITISLLLFIVVSGFITKKYKEPKQKYILIEDAKITLDTSEIALKNYWISNFEVTNAQYKKFLLFLKESNRADDYNIAKIDSTLWRIEYSYCEPLVEYYHAHPAYKDYPVVNISYKAAKLYCQWLTNQDESQLYVYSLPTKAQWIYAASGGHKYLIYPWGGPHLIDDKGEPLCNYLRIGDIGIRRDSIGELVVNSIRGIVSTYGITEAYSANIVNAYPPNDFKLYNMSGNVSEMIDQDGVALGGGWNSPGYDVRIKSVEKYSGPSPSIGFRVVRALKSE